MRTVLKWFIFSVSICSPLCGAGLSGLSEFDGSLAATDELVINDYDAGNPITRRIDASQLFESFAADPTWSADFSATDWRTALSLGSATSTQFGYLSNMSEQPLDSSTGYTQAAADAAFATAAQGATADSALQLADLYPQGFSQQVGLQLFDHRGWPDVYPELTLTAYERSVADGAEYIECDVHVLADGSLGVMHDSTVDRTTESTGAPSDFTQFEWRNMVADCSTYLHANWADERPALLADVLRLYGNKVKLLLEPQSADTPSRLLEQLEVFGIDKDMVAINSFSASRLPLFRAAGYTTYLNYTTYTGDPLTEVDDGVLFNHLNNEPALIATLQAEGVLASVYTIDNYYQMRRYSSADSIWTDQGGYLRGNHRLTEDPFAQQVWYHGHIASNGDGANDGRGEFYGVDEWGVDASATSVTWRGALAGWANPLTGVDTTDGVSTVPAVSIDFEVKFISSHSTSRFAWLHISTTDDALITDANQPGVGAAFDGSGYSFLAKQNGELTIYRITDGELDSLTGTNAAIVENTADAVAISNGGSARYRVTVTSSNLKLERLDVAYECEVIESAYRGGFLHYGCKGAYATFRNISIN